MAKKKMTMRRWEKSPMDAAEDKKLRAKGIKEGSKADNAADRKALDAFNRKHFGTTKAKKRAKRR